MEREIMFIYFLIQAFFMLGLSSLAFRFDYFHLAIVFLTNLEIGYITPPVGINLFISSFRFNRPVLELYKVSIPFLFLMLFALIIITYIPWLTLFWFAS